MKTWIIAHGDADGVTSAAITLAALGGEVYFSHPAGLLIDLKERVSIGDRVVICDIALSEAHLSQILGLLSKLSRAGEVIYIDHHPLPKQVSCSDFPGVLVHEEGPCTAELAYRYFQDKLSEDMARVAIYGAIGDYAFHTPFFKENIEKWDVRSIFFEAGVLAQGLEGSRRMYDFKRIVVRHLASNGLPSQLSELVVRALIEAVKEEDMRKKVKEMVKTCGCVAYVLDPEGSLGKAARYAAVFANKPVGLAGETRGRFIDISARVIRGDSIDLNKILREIGRELGIHAGGHKKAAGARVPVSLFSKFLKMLSDKIYENYGGETSTGNT